LRERTFNAVAEVVGLPHPVIMNCLGLGAGPVFDDKLMVPLRGQLVLMKPQPLPYLLSHSVVSGIG
jgi:hypothetical protein